MNSRHALTLGAAVVFAAVLAACGGNSYSSPMSPSPIPTPPTGSGADLVITITGQNGTRSFSPNPGSLTTGRKVAFFNADSVVHTATADNGAFDTGNIGPGALSGLITIAAAGSYSYHCLLHPTMVGTLNVTQ